MNSYSNNVLDYRKLIYSQFDIIVYEDSRFTVLKMEKVKTYYKKLGVHGPLLIGFLLVLLIGYIAFTSFSFGGTLNEKEANLMNADLTRSSLLFILDSSLSAFLVLFPLVLILDFMLRYKIKKKTAITTILIVGMLILPNVFLNVQATTPMKTQVEGSIGAPLAKYVFIITFDGARYDVFWSSAQYIIQHKNESAWANHIVCTYPTITYPNHVSLMTGTWPQIHLTQNNPPKMEFGTKRYASLILRTYHTPVVDDILKIASKEGFTTAVFTAPSTLAQILGSSETYRSSGEGSVGTMDNVIEYLQNHLAEIKSKGFVTMVHLVDTDSVLHAYGTDSEQYRYAMYKNAEQVKRLISTLENLGLADESVVIVTADHGGIGKQHFNVWPPLVAEIPLWMWGKPFKKGYELAGGRIIDIAPTVAYILGIPISPKSVGIVLYSALNETIIQEVRGEAPNLAQLEGEEINRAIGLIYSELVLWYTMIVFIIWLILALVADIWITKVSLKKVKTK